MKNNPNKNPNCEDIHCRDKVSEVRLLPWGPKQDGNTLYCHACYERERKDKRERDRMLDEGVRYELPAWETLKVYGKE